MKPYLFIIPFMVISTISIGQNQLVSQGVLYDGEPYITVNPSNPQHMVVAWLGYKPLQYVIIKKEIKEIILNCLCLGELFASGLLVLPPFPSRAYTCPACRGGTHFLGRGP